MFARISASRARPASRSLPVTRSTAGRPRATVPAGRVPYPRGAAPPRPGRGATTARAGAAARPVSGRYGGRLVVRKRQGWVQAERRSARACTPHLSQQAIRPPDMNSLRAAATLRSVRGGDQYRAAQRVPRYEAARRGLQGVRRAAVTGGRRRAPGCRHPTVAFEKVCLTNQFFNPP